MGKDAMKPLPNSLPNKASEMLPDISLSTASVSSFPPRASPTRRTLLFSLFVPCTRFSFCSRLGSYRPGSGNEFETFMKESRGRARVYLDAETMVSKECSWDKMQQQGGRREAKIHLIVGSITRHR